MRNTVPSRRINIRQSQKLIKKARDTEYLNKHAGKWVLVVDEQVIASGDTLGEITKQVAFKKHAGNLSDTFVFHVPTPEEALAILRFYD